MGAAGRRAAARGGSWTSRARSVLPDRPTRGQVDVWVDASLRPGLGAVAGWVLVGRGGRESGSSERYAAGGAVEAEGLAVGLALAAARERYPEASRFVVRTDSHRVADTLRGLAPLPPWATAVLEGGYGAVVEVRWVPRAKNREADAVARAGWSPT